ncbi:MAG: FtsX-like permease family protein [Bryobacteraceae bacterium]
MVELYTVHAARCRGLRRDPWDCCLRSLASSARFPISVSARKKELGIRVALGARPWQLLKMILYQTLVISGAGVAIGIVLGIAATILLRSRFFGIGLVEWTVLIPVGVAMVAISLIVAYLSARAWIAVDPMDAVRHA